MPPNADDCGVLNALLNEVAPGGGGSEKLLKEQSDIVDLLRSLNENHGERTYDDDCEVIAGRCCCCWFTDKFPIMEFIDGVFVGL